jgi:hypothetical protein
MTIQRAGGFKKVTKVSAPDGTLHDSQKAAVEHMRGLRIKEALEQFANLSPSNCEGVNQTDEGAFVVYIQDMPQFLFNNGAAISAALNQQVPVRKPRVKKVKQATVPPVIATGVAA